MDGKLFCLLISIINVCFGSAVHYLDNKAPLNDDSGDINILCDNSNNHKFFHCSFACLLSGCTINVNADLSDPQPLIIKPRTAAFWYPLDKTGIVNLADGEEVEVYCTSGFRIPAGVENSVLAKCVDGNLFEVYGTAYNFINFTCNSIPYHTTRKTGTKCFNNATKVEIGFDLENRFLKVLEVCHDEVVEETYFAKYQLTPASEG